MGAANQFATASPHAAEAPAPVGRAAHDRMANAIRALAMDAVEQAKSGHPGLPMGAADIATVLFTRFLKFDPAKPHWPDRDRFVLSAGHGSMLLYALLYLLGYEAMTIDEIKRFRQLGSLTAGHPEHDHPPGVETTTGPLGLIITPLSWPPTATSWRASATKRSRSPATSGLQSSLCSTMTTASRSTARCRLRTRSIKSSASRRAAGTRPGSTGRTRKRSPPPSRGPSRPTDQPLSPAAPPSDSAPPPRQAPRTATARRSAQTKSKARGNG